MFRPFRLTSWLAAAAVAALGVLPPEFARASDGPLGRTADERWDDAVDADVSYEPRISAPTWVVPSSALPPEIAVQPANNNLSIALSGGRLFLAWRTAPNHFASSRARIYVVSSPDLGRTWARE